MPLSISPGVTIPLGGQPVSTVDNLQPQCLSNHGVYLGFPDVRVAGEDDLDIMYGSIIRPRF